MISLNIRRKLEVTLRMINLWSAFIGVVHGYQIQCNTLPHVFYRLNAKKLDWRMRLVRSSTSFQPIEGFALASSNIRTWAFIRYLTKDKASFIFTDKIDDAI